MMKLKLKVGMARGPVLRRRNAEPVPLTLPFVITLTLIITRNFVTQLSDFSRVSLQGGPKK